MEVDQDRMRKERPAMEGEEAILEGEEQCEQRRWRYVT